jgi:hypothetical protein
VQKKLAENPALAFYKHFELIILFTNNRMAIIDLTNMLIVHCHDYLEEEKRTVL